MRCLLLSLITLLTGAAGYSQSPGRVSAGAIRWDAWHGDRSQNVQKAVAWVNARPDAAPARAILIYAWNENDEDGWLVPTRGDGDWRVRAVGQALRATQSSSAKTITGMSAKSK